MRRALPCFFVHCHTGRPIAPVPAQAAYLSQTRRWSASQSRCTQARVTRTKFSADDGTLTTPLAVLL